MNQHAGRSISLFLSALVCLAVVAIPQKGFARLTNHSGVRAGYWNDRAVVLGKVLSQEKTQNGVVVVRFEVESAANPALLTGHLQEKTLEMQFGEESPPASKGPRERIKGWFSEQEKVVVLLEKRDGVLRIPFPKYQMVTVQWEFMPRQAPAMNPILIEKFCKECDEPYEVALQDTIRLCRALAIQDSDKRLEELIRLNQGQPGECLTGTLWRVFEHLSRENGPNAERALKQLNEVKLRWAKIKAAKARKQQATDGRHNVPGSSPEMVVGLPAH